MNKFANFFKDRKIESFDLKKTNKRIFFVHNTSDIYFENIPNDSIVVYHKDYSPPYGLQNCKYFVWDDYVNKYANLEVNCIVFVGLNKIITPSNRCDFVFEYISTLTANLMKISIDDLPFVGEPWRLFFHYLCTNKNKFGYPHSYAIETEWKHWFYKNVDSCCFDKDKIKKFISNTFSNLDELKTKFEFYESSSSQIENYNEIRKFVFNKYNTPKLFINNILKMTNKHNGIEFDFDSYIENKKFMLPDLKIYKFVVEENVRRMNVFNEVIK